MALDFPSSPTVGQQYPSPPVAGQPVYTWDGAKWTTNSGNISGAAPATALPLADATPALVGTSGKYAREDHVHPTDPGISGSVRYDAAQSLSTPQRQQARQNIYAAPFDAMAYLGLQVNGAIDISQELGFSNPITNRFVCDGWHCDNTNVVNYGAYPDAANFPGYTNCIVGLIQTAVPSLAAGDFDFLNTKIEGYRAARLAWGTANAQPITISFWTRHHRPGTYTVSIRNAPTNNRAYVTSYTHNVADVAQYNVVTIPGDTTGTWFTDNRAFMELGFAMACGTNLAAPSANNWLAGSYVGAPGQINAIAATTDAFRITGLTVFPGNEAPSAARAPFIVRPYDQELSLCKRYLQIVLPEGAGIANGTTACGFSIRHSGMRAVPTATTTNVVTISDIAALNSTQSAVGVNISGNDAEGGWYYLLNFPSNLTLGKIYICLGGALSAGRVKLDARL